MSLSVIQPPTFRELIAIPEWRAHLLKAPRLPGGCRTSEPFRVWGIRNDGRWAGKNVEDYRAAFDLAKKMLAKPDDYRDIVIVCRPVSFGPPQSLVLPAGTSWCGHCRRPTVYRRVRSHAAMKRWSVVDDDPAIKRCYYCAAREQRFWHW